MEIDQLRKKIQSMFVKDSILLAITIVLVWCVILAIFPQALSLATSAWVNVFIWVIMIIVLVTISSSILAVFLHIKRNKSEIYAEELKYQKNPCNKLD